MSKLKVALIGIYYPLAMLRYFEKALQNRDDVELWTCGPYSGNNIPWNGGMTVSPKYSKSPDFPMRIGMRTVPGHLLESIAPWEPDLWLIVDAGFQVYPRPKGLTAYIATDPHVLNYDQQRASCDHFFCMQTPYMKPGDHYLPYAYSLDYHFPEDVEKKFDACMIGLHYPQRDVLVNKLRNRNISVYYDIGPIYDEYRHLYNQSKIGLNWSSLLDLNARAFELPAMAICPVMNPVPDMNTFFVAGEHYLPFKTVEEAEKQVILALSDDAMREEIAQNAYRKVKPHTYNARIQQVLETVRLR